MGMIRFAQDFWTSKMTQLCLGYLLYNIGDCVARGTTVKECVAKSFLALAACFLRDTVAKGFEAPVVIHNPTEDKGE